MYDDYSIRDSNETIKVTGVLIAEDDLPFSADLLDGLSLNTDQVLELLESDDLIAVSTALADKDVLQHLDEATNEMGFRYLIEGLLDGYDTIQQAVAYNQIRNMLFFVTVVS